MISIDERFLKGERDISKLQRCIQDQRNSIESRLIISEDNGSSTSSL
jgi:hypothetical protein